MKQKKIKGLSRKEYFKAYCEANKDKIAEKGKAYREANKDKIKAYCEAKQKHQKEHPEEYLKVLGTNVYTNGVTKEMEKQLPELIDKKVKEMLDELGENTLPSATSKKEGMELSLNPIPSQTDNKNKGSGTKPSSRGI